MANRNSQAHFELAPQVEIERSTFDRSCNIKTAFNVGSLIPFYVDEVLPGDTFQIETSKVARLQTLLTPVMDNLYLDTYYFFVPNRLIWDHWQEFMGENNTDYWTSNVEYAVPRVVMPSNGWNVGTLADYMGVPAGIANTDANNQISINALPFRAYAKIFNDWFRDENLVRPLYIYTGDSNTTGSNGNTYVDVIKGGYPCKAAKYHDYFTSCLPAPQKGQDVPFLGGYVPVITDNSLTALSGTYPPMKMKYSSGTLPGSSYPIYIGNESGEVKINNEDPAGSLSSDGLHPINLFADLAKTISSTDSVYFNANMNSINSLRQAFQIQRMLEKDARGGTRYIELLKSHFGVTSPDARLQRSEYLGGNRVPFNIEQVIQTSGTTTAQATELGSVAGMSQTNDINYDVNKSFVEHGFIIGLMVARYDHTYQQGLERFWSRISRYDYYWPALAHLGEQAVHKQEIYLTKDTYTEDRSSQIFGYQEAWAEYRYKPNLVTGPMRTEADSGFDSWHFADYYGATPTLSEAWIKEDEDNVNRTLAVTATTTDPAIFIDIYVKNKCTRPMPLYSIPGLIDHF